MKFIYSLTAFVVLGFHGLSSAEAQTWTPVGTPYGVGMIAVSANGCKLAATTSGNHLITSLDAGKTWQENQSVPFQFAGAGTALSADGTMLLAGMIDSGGVRIVLSTNFGATWTQASVPLGAVCWQFAVSATGKTLAAAAYGASSLIYVSTNFGQTWTNGGSPALNWAPILGGTLACSTDGTKLVAAASGDKVYVSTNFRNHTWTATGSSNASWMSIACNADGTRLIASGDATYVSTNFGGSWVVASPHTGHVASSADGTKLIIGGNSTYVSSDSGATWVSNSAPQPWQCVVSSADGSELLASYRYGLWIGRTFPSPHLNMNFATSNVQLSWLVPSTNFVLQQNTDLRTTNWLSLTNAPTLDPVTLHEQVTLSLTNHSLFFRLITQ